MTDSLLPMTRPLRWLETQSGPKCYNCVTAMQSIISTDFLFPSSGNQYVENETTVKLRSRVLLARVHFWCLFMFQLFFCKTLGLKSYEEISHLKSVSHKHTGLKKIKES